MPTYVSIVYMLLHRLVVVIRQQTYSA